MISTSAVVLGTPKADTATAPTKTWSIRAARRERSAALTTATNDRGFAGIVEAPCRVDQVRAHVERRRRGEALKSLCRLHKRPLAVFLPRAAARTLHDGQEHPWLFRNYQREAEGAALTSGCWGG